MSQEADSKGKGTYFTFDSNSIVNICGLSYFNRFKFDSYSSNTIFDIDINSRCTDIGDITLATQFLKRILFLLPAQKHLQQFVFEIVHPV